MENKYPTEIIDLPSGGFFYDSANKLSSGKIELLLPTAKHEDILTSRSLIIKGIVIDTLLKSLIVSKEINYNSILIGDKNGIMLASRILLYGPEYEVNVSCPACTVNSNIKIMLNDLEIKNIDYTNLNKGINEFIFELPKSKKTIKYKLLTIGDEIDINSELNVFKKYATVSQAEVSTRLAYSIIEYDGITDKTKIKQKILNEMPTRDSRTLRLEIKKHMPGIIEEIEFECSNCDHSDIIRLPFEIEFFWPTKGL